MPALTPHTWALHLLLIGAVLATVPDLFDAQVPRRAALALLAALVLAPFLATLARDATGEWFRSAGARWLVLGFALCLVRGWSHLDEAATTDRLLGFGLIHVAGVLGVLAYERAPWALGSALRWAGLIAALVAWAQALGMESRFSPGPDEIVALSGSSTRAGALLALGSLAWLVRVSMGPGESEREIPSPDAGEQTVRLGLTTVLPWLGLVLVSGAFVLTRARGARYATLAALLAWAFAHWWNNRGRGAPQPSRPGPGLGWRPALLCVLAGLGLATAVGGMDTLIARKLEGSAPILSGDDVTTQVRLAVFDTTAGLIADEPLTGVGLGRFRAEYPPYRDAAEAARPGLAGASTEVRHPHNEFLLASAEGGLAAGLALVVFALMTLRRALRRGSLRDPASTLAGLLFSAGVVLALGQDAWEDPTTALPIFAAAGLIWAARPDEARAYVPTPRPLGFAVVVLGLGLGLLAWPRLDAHLSLRSFFLRATENQGVIDEPSFEALLRAADMGAGDIDIQRMTREYAAAYAPMVPDAAGKIAAIQAHDTARDRLAVLAPHVD